MDAIVSVRLQSSIVSQQEFLEKVMSGEEVAEIFRLNLKRIRKAAGVSQLALSRRSGILQSQLSELEGGKTRPSLETLARIAESLGVGPWLLLLPPEVKKPVNPG